MKITLIQTLVILGAATATNAASLRGADENTSGPPPPRANKYPYPPSRHHEANHHGSLFHPPAIMPIGPSHCPCWSQSDLNYVTADNVSYPGSDSCLITGDSSQTVLRILDESKEFVVDRLSNDDFKCFQCESGDGCSYTNGISKVEFETCTQQIKDRCGEIGSPVPPEVTTCPCFDSTDLLTVTAENADEDTCWIFRNSDESYSSRTLSSSSANVSFRTYYEGDNNRCSSQNQSQVITEGELDACFVLMGYRCRAINLPVASAA